MKSHDVNGREVNDPTPVEIPAGMRKPETTAEIIARLVRHEVSRAAERQGFESFDEANDFDVEEDDLPLSLAERHAMKEEWPSAEEWKAFEDWRAKRKSVSLSGADGGVSGKKKKVSSRAESDDGGSDSGVEESA